MASKTSLHSVLHDRHMLSLVRVGLKLKYNSKRIKVQQNIATRTHIVEYERYKEHAMYMYVLPSGYFCGK